MPALNSSSDHTVDIFAAIRDTEGDDDDIPDGVLDEIQDMEVDAQSSARMTRRQRQNALKYMEQLQRIADRKQKGIVVDLQDIAEVSVAPFF